MTLQTREMAGEGKDLYNDRPPLSPLVSREISMSYATASQLISASTFDSALIDVGGLRVTSH
jgi:hypothetical protein